MTPDRTRQRFGYIAALQDLAEVLRREQKSKHREIIETILYYGSPEEAYRQGGIPQSDLSLVTTGFYLKYGLIPAPGTRPIVTMPDLDVFFFQVLNHRKPDRVIEDLLRKDKSGQLRKNVKRICIDIFNETSDNCAIALRLTNPLNPNELIVGRDLLRAQIAPGSPMALWTSPVMYSDELDSPERGVSRVLQYEVLPHKTADGELPFGGEFLKSLIPDGITPQSQLVYNVLVDVYTFPAVGITSKDLERASEFSRLKNIGFASISNIRKQTSTSFRLCIADTFEEKIPAIASVNTKIQQCDALRRFVESN